MGLISRTGRILILALLIACRAEATITINAQTATSNGTSGSSWNTAYPATIAAGNYAVFSFSFDNAGSAGNTLIAPATMSDSKGNTFARYLDVLYDNGPASAGVEIACYMGKVATQVTNADTFTITWTSGSPAAKCANIMNVSVSAGNMLTNVTSGEFVCGTCTTGTPSVTTGTITVGDLTVGLCGAESADTFTNDTDTTNGSWTTAATTHNGTGSGTTGMSLCAQGKVQTTTNSTQTYNPTLTSVDTKIGWVQFREAAIPLANGFLFFFPK